MKKSGDEKLNLNIRKALIDDVPLILKFIKELSVYEKNSKEVVTTEDTLRETLFGDKSYAQVLIAEIEEKPVGHALYFYNFSTFMGRPGLYIEDVYVSEEYRRQGIGTALFKKCAYIAKENKCVRMEWSVLKWDPAREFYDHMGAKPMDEWVVYRLTGDTLDKMADL